MIDDADVQILLDGRNRDCRKESFDPATIKRENLKPLFIDPRVALLWLVHTLGSHRSAGNRDVPLGRTTYELHTTPFVSIDSLGRTTGW